ncbi:MAG: hypothetical protein C0448_16250, partial [Sphingobacteriaceae bacterium]|nr:hypothetical protein [Sphingobacteriaceae bacterium]
MKRTNMKTIKKFLLSITIPLLISSFNANADIKTGNSQATASINPACRVKVDNLNFGDVSIQSTSGNGDVFATTELSL